MLLGHRRARARGRHGVVARAVLEVRNPTHHAVCGMGSCQARLVRHRGIRGHRHCDAATSSGLISARVRLRILLHICRAAAAGVARWAARSRRCHGRAACSPSKTRRTCTTRRRAVSLRGASGWGRVSSPKRLRARGGRAPRPSCLRTRTTRPLSRCVHTRCGGARA